MKHTIGFTVDPKRPNAIDRSGTTTAVRNANNKSNTVMVAWAKVPNGGMCAASSYLAWYSSCILLRIVFTSRGMVKVTEEHIPMHPSR
mmetsp:Transcript_4050/g.25436  ORF Transcript_4050/g.25436 Transcript_4050/m.25436 type:complete len:88 (-) Transcript_4050:1176-1439(-)